MLGIFGELGWAALKHAKALCLDVHRVYLVYGIWTLFIWVCYPVAWGCSESDNLIALDSEAVFLWCTLTSPSVEHLAAQHQLLKEEWSTFAANAPASRDNRRTSTSLLLAFQATSERPRFWPTAIFEGRDSPALNGKQNSGSRDQHQRECLVSEISGHCCVLCQLHTNGAWNGCEHVRLRCRLL